MVQRVSWIAKLAGIALLLLGCETLGVEPTLTPVDPRQPLPTLAIRIEIQTEPTPTVAEPDVVEEDAEPPEMPTPPAEDVAATLRTPEVPAEDAPPAPARTPETPAAEDSDSAEPPDNGEELVAQGEEVYQANCVTCHEADGQGTTDFPALAGNQTVVDEDPTVILDVIIHGRGEMPAFGDALSNEEIAAVASYIRTAWGNQAPSVSEEQVAKVAQTN